MSVIERDYVIAIKNLGAGIFRFAFNHIIPNILGPVVVVASFEVASAFAWNLRSVSLDLG